MHLPALLAALVSLTVPARAAISIIYPGSDTIWYKNNTVALNWTTTSPDSDTYLFRALLSNTDQSLLSGNHTIADSTNATANYERVLLPSLPAGKGYIVNFVNTTDENQVFASSPSFEIQDGTVSNTTTTIPVDSGSASSTSTSAGDIPNAHPTGTSSNPFATASATPTTSRSAAARTARQGASGFGVTATALLAGILFGLAALI